MSRPANPPNAGHRDFTHFQQKLRVITIWALAGVCSLLTAYFILQNSVNVPFSDDWAIYWWIGRGGEISAKWLWAPHNEHRIPLSKLLFLAAHYGSGGDLRAGCWVTWGLLTSLSVGLMLLARRIRGELSFADLIFPLIALHFGHSENLLWSFQVQFSSAALLTGMLLIAVAWNAEGPKHISTLMLIGLCGILLCGFGGSAVVFVPLPILWLTWLGWRRWREQTSQSRRFAGIAWASSAVCLAALVIYFLGLPTGGSGASRPTLAMILRTSAQFLQMGLNPFLKELWPIPAWAVIVGLSWVCVRLLMRLRSAPLERPRTIGLLLFLGGFIALTLGIGWARSGPSPESGFIPRYTLPSMMSLCLIYVTAIVCLTGRWRGIVTGTLCGLMFVLYWHSFDLAAERHAPRRILMKSFEHDVQSGQRTVLLADRYSFLVNNPVHQVLFPFPEHMALAIQDLRKRQAGPFKPSPADGPLRFEGLDPEPSVIQGVEWDAKRHAAQLSASSGRLTFTLPTSQFIQRIYLEPRLIGPIPRSGVQLKTRYKTVGGTEQETPPLMLFAPEQVLSIPVDAEVAEFSFQFEKAPVEFRFGTDTNLYQDYRILLATGRPAR